MNSAGGSKPRGPGFQTGFVGVVLVRTFVGGMIFGGGGKGAGAGVTGGVATDVTPA